MRRGVYVRHVPLVGLLALQQRLARVPTGLTPLFRVSFRTVSVTEADVFPILVVGLVSTIGSMFHFYRRIDVSVEQIVVSFFPPFAVYS